jgi:hypothetical protein
MSRGQNTIKRSEVSTTPILLKYPTSIPSASFFAKGITVNRGINSTYSSDGIQFLNYALVKQLYYQEYLTGSLLFSSSYWNDSLQSTAAKGTFDDDYRYFPTSSSAEVTILAIPRTTFGEQISRNTLYISSSTYRLIDDGNGNILDTFTTGSQPSTNISYATDGVKLYSAGYDIDGTGPALQWKTANAGGSYAGTFWTNPVTANKTGRLNYTGFWSAKSLVYLGDFAITFNITVASNTTYYFGIACDNYGSLYLDNNLIIRQIIPDADGTGGNYKYWHIYPIDITSGTHTIKFVGTNAGIPNPGNPGSMGIEVYNNTATQISASIAASPMGSSTPVGLTIVYSSKDHLTDTVYTQNNRIGNILYSQGVMVITDEEYQEALIPPAPAIINWTRDNYENNGFINNTLVIIYTNYYTGAVTTLNVPSGGTGTPLDAGSLTVAAGTSVLVSAQNTGASNIYYILTSAAINSDINGNLISVNIPIGSSAYTASEQTFTAASGVTYTVSTYGSATLP